MDHRDRSVFPCGPPQRAVRPKKKVSDQQRSRVHGILSLLNAGFRWKVWRIHILESFKTFFFCCQASKASAEISFKSWHQKCMSFLLMVQNSKELTSCSKLTPPCRKWRLPGSMPIETNDWATSRLDYPRANHKKYHAFAICSFFIPSFWVCCLVAGPYFCPVKKTPGAVAFFPCEKETLTFSHWMRMRNLPAVSAKDGSSSEHNLLTLGMKIVSLVVCLSFNAKVSNWKSIKSPKFGVKHFETTG